MRSANRATSGIQLKRRCDSRERSVETREHLVTNLPNKISIPAGRRSSPYRPAELVLPAEAARRNATIAKNIASVLQRRFEREAKKYCSCRMVVCAQRELLFHFVSKDNVKF